MEYNSDKGFPAKKRILEIKKTPDLLIIHLLQKDPLIRTFYKRSKKNISYKGNISLQTRLSLMKENPGIGFNRELWIRLKESLLRLGEDEKFYSPTYSEADKQMVPADEGSFFMWLLTTVGLSPHHTRQMVRHYLKAQELLGRSIRNWTGEDVLYLMIRRLRKGRGGAQEIFELSRLFWLYSSDQNKLDDLILRIRDLTGVSE